MTNRPTKHQRNSTTQRLIFTARAGEPRPAHKAGAGDQESVGEVAL